MTQQQWLPVGSPCCCLPSSSPRPPSAQEGTASPYAAPRSLLPLQQLPAPPRRTLSREGARRGRGRHPAADGQGAEAAEEWEEGEPRGRRNSREAMEERLVHRPKKRDKASSKEELNLDNLALLGLQWWVVRVSRVTGQDIAERVARVLARNYPDMDFKINKPKPVAADEKEEIFHQAKQEQEKYDKSFEEEQAEGSFHAG